MEKWARTATLEQRKRASLIGSIGSSGKGMTMDQVQAIVDRPLQTLLEVYVSTTVQLLAKMTNMTILCTETTPGFITGDEPVVWFDPEACKRAPLYRAPALMCDTIEITLPISPSRMMFLGRKNEDWPLYMNLDAIDPLEYLLDDLNRRTCRSSRNKVVVSRNTFRPIWAEYGDLPPDAWRPPKTDGEDDLSF